jgi:hypothetical protein
MRLVRKPTLNGRKADAERETQACFCPTGLCRVWRQLVDVIFETIERIREQDDTVLLLEQHALVAFEIADYLCVPEFGRLDNLGTQAARRVLRHRSQPGRPFW